MEHAFWHFVHLDLLDTIVWTLYGFFFVRLKEQKMQSWTERKRYAHLNGLELDFVVDKNTSHTNSIYAHTKRMGRVEEKQSRLFSDEAYGTSVLLNVCRWHFFRRSSNRFVSPFSFVVVEISSSLLLFLCFLGGNIQIFHLIQLTFDHNQFINEKSGRISSFASPKTSLRSHLGSNTWKNRTSEIAFWLLLNWSWKTFDFIIDRFISRVKLELPIAFIIHFARILVGNGYAKFTCSHNQDWSMNYKTQLKCNGSNRLTKQQVVVVYASLWCFIYLHPYAMFVSLYAFLE